MWTLSKIWNESIDQKEEKPVVARNRLWASELGKSDIDLYWKLQGEQPSNPFDARAKRKFEAGFIRMDCETYSYPLRNLQRKSTMVRIQNG